MLYALGSVLLRGLRTHGPGTIAQIISWLHAHTGMIQADLSPGVLIASNPDTMSRSSEVMVICRCW